jgi:hypothetical protein
MLSIEGRESNSTFKIGMSESEEYIGSIKKENGRRSLIDTKQEKQCKRTYFSATAIF